MSSERRKLAYTAMESHFEAQRAEALHNLLVYFENPAGIGEHPEVGVIVGTMLAVDRPLDMLSLIHI